MNAKNPRKKVGSPGLYSASATNSVPSFVSVASLMVRNGFSATLTWLEEAGQYRDVPLRMADSSRLPMLPRASGLSRPFHFLSDYLLASGHRETRLRLSKATVLQV
jgi:hypothetical protein